VLAAARLFRVPARAKAATLLVEGETARGEGTTRVVEGGTAGGEGATRVVEGETAGGEGTTRVVEGGTAGGEGTTRVVEGGTAGGEGATRLVEGETARGGAATRLVDREATLTPATTTGAAHGRSGGADARRRDLTAPRRAVTLTRDAMPEQVALSPQARRVAGAAVREKVVAVIGKRVPPADRDDVAQAAYLRLLLMAHLPESESELLGLVVCVVRGLVVDFHRRRVVREVRTVEGADVDGVAFDADVAGVVEREEWRRMLDFAEREVAAGRVAPEVLGWARRLAGGDTLGQIAADEGIAVGTLKVRLHRAREHLRKSWAGYAAGVAVAIALLFLGRHEDSSMTGAAPPRDDEAAAAYARSRAAGECHDRDFVACKRDLDEAKAIDPGGEARPEVRAMRDAIQYGLLDGAVPR
jgi:DNA-directed RNA polymerase specialized sigma24 family protein